MTIATEVRRLADSKPFYAVAGCGDLAVEKLREVPGRLQEAQGRFQEVQGRFQEVQGRLQKAQGQLQDQLQSQLTALPTDRVGLQERALTYADSLASLATSTYEDLAKRGHGVVGRVSGQEANQELEARARTTSQQAKAAATSARKTASSAKKAASDGADKIG